MKKSLLLLFCLSFILNFTEAQITVNADDIVPIGYIALQTRDTLPDASIVAGGVGNIDWDFSALQDGNDGEFKLLDINDTPFASSFPNSNFSLEIEPGLYAYLEKDNDGLRTIGIEGTLASFGFPVNGKLEVTPSQSLIRFPANLGDSYDETIQQVGQTTGAALGFPSFDSVRLVIDIVRNVEIDAFGQMTIPVGTYETIRSTEMEMQTSQLFSLSNSVWVPVAPPSTSNLINYNWWVNEGDSLAFPLVSMEFNVANSTSEVTFLKELISNVNNLFQSEAVLYPNPTSEFVNIDFENPFSGSIEIYNNQGQLVLAKNSIGVLNEKNDLKECAPGVHIAVLKNEKGHFAGYHKIVVQ